MPSPSDPGAPPPGEGRPSPPPEGRPSPPPPGRPSPPPPSPPPPGSAEEALRRIEQRLDRATEATERLMAQAAEAAAAAGAGKTGAGAGTPGAGAGTPGAGPGDPGAGNGDRDGVKPPPAGWQVPEDAPPGVLPDLEPFVALVQALRDLIPPELQRRLVAALRELLLALRALIDWYLERLERRREQSVEVQDIPIL